MKKTIIIIIVVLVLAGAGYYFYAYKKGGNPYNYNYGADNNQNSQYQNSGQNPPTPVTAPATQTQTNNNPNGPDYTPSSSPTGGEVAAPNVQVSEVDFDGSKFSPNPVTIKTGDYIFFKNASNVNFWPAPAANGGYAGFDSFKDIAPGGEFKFQFNKAGTWLYYDYDHPNVTGTVIVTP